MRKEINGLDIDTLAKGIRLAVIDELIKELQMMKLSLKCPICSEN